MTTSTDQLHQNCRDIVCDLESTEKTEYSTILDDALDIEFTTDRQGKYLAARLLVAFGGPNIWIDTRNDRVEGYWGGDQFFLSYEDANDLHGASEELFECFR